VSRDGEPEAAVAGRAVSWTKVTVTPASSTEHLIGHERVEGGELVE
jgi:hypothetical protein